MLMYLALTSTPLGGHNARKTEDGDDGDRGDVDDDDDDDDDVMMMR